MSTRRYYMDDCFFTLPVGYRDQTTHLLEWPAADGSPIVLAVQRDPIPAPLAPGRGEPFDFDAYVAEQLREHPQRFPGYRLDRDESLQRSGVELRRKSFRWNKDLDVVYHHQVFALAPPVVLLFSGAAKAQSRAEVDALMDEVLQNLQFRVD